MDPTVLIGHEVVVTEKMDGENTNLYADRYHARSVDSRHHPSRDWVKAYWGNLRYQIPKGWRICGENVYAKHSVYYTNLKSYFYGFAMYDEKNECLPWDLTLEFFEMLGIVPVPTIWRGCISRADDLMTIKKLAEGFDFTKQEGYVVRTTEGFSYADVLPLAGKFVRKDHVKTNKHWMFEEIIPNKLA